MITAKCTKCGVEILNGVVQFSAGKPGSLARLAARVCKYGKEEPGRVCAIKNIIPSISEESIKAEEYQLPEDRNERLDSYL